MKKKIILLLIIFLANICCVKAFDTSLKIYDYAQVLSSEEESNLKVKIDDYIEKYNMDMVLVTVKHHEKSTTRAYAEDFYDYNGFGMGDTHDGILFVIDFNFGYRDIQFITTGEAIRVYDDYRLDNMYDNIEAVAKKDYYTWFDTFIDDASEYASLGIPESNKNTYIDENGDYISYSKPTINYLLIIILSLLIPSIVVGIFIGKNKMIRKAANANYYILKDSININDKSDKFITTHTTSVRINTDSSSGHGGGSSVSRGSSGTMHGGGGGRRL